MRTRLGIEFEKLKARTPYSHPILNESYFVSRFTNGLNVTLRLMVNTFYPMMVEQAVEKARLQELALEAIYRKHGLPLKSFLKSSQQDKGNSMATLSLQQEVNELPIME